MTIVLDAIKDVPTTVPSVMTVTDLGLSPATAPASPTTVVVTPPSGLSTGAVVGIGLAGAAVLGGIVYAATRGGSRGRR